LKADLAEAAWSIDFFWLAVTLFRTGLRENQSQKFALSLSGGFSTWLSAQPDGR